jgi:hypothetical protein
LRGKQTGDEVEVFGGVGVDVLVERVGDIFTAVFFNSVPCTVWGDGVEEVVNAIGVGDRGGACDVCNLGEEDVDTMEDQQV